jgi:hypothetical protein
MTHLERRGAFTLACIAILSRSVKRRVNRFQNATVELGRTQGQQEIHMVLAGHNFGDVSFSRLVWISRLGRHHHRRRWLSIIERRIGLMQRLDRDGKLTFQNHNIRERFQREKAIPRIAVSCVGQKKSGPRAWGCGAVGGRLEVVAALAVPRRGANYHGPG